MVSLSSVHKLIKGTTGLQITPGAVKCIRNEMEEKINSIARDASFRAASSKRNTIRPRDVCSSPSKSNPKYLKINPIRRMVKKCYIIRIGKKATMLIARESERYGEKLILEAEKLCVSGNAKRIKEKNVIFASQMIDGRDAVSK